MVECRKQPSPLSVLMDKNIIKDWKKGLKHYIHKKPITKGITFQIQNYCKLKYKDGNVLVSMSYAGNYIPFRI